MNRDSRVGSTIDEEGLTDAQCWAVVRVGVLAFALALTMPLYYYVVALVPAIATVVPALAAHAAMAVGLLVVLPAALVYAHVLANRTGGESIEYREYGVNDHWERQNL